MLKENLMAFSVPNYGKTQRNENTYQTVAEYCKKNLVRLIDDYQTDDQNNKQLLREIRNDIDYYLRRYHEYCIKQRNGVLAHYHELDCVDQCDFEHLIPASRIRDLLLSNKITVVQALNAPTVRLSRSKHHALKDSGWASHTPDMWFPFKRYNQVFRAKFKTHDGTVIDTDKWTLADHYRYFDHLII